MMPGGHPDPLGQGVTNRRRTIQESLALGDPDAAWYQGKAQALIYHKAQEIEAPVPMVRKSTAAESSKMPWDHEYADSPANQKLGRAGQTVFPNIENSGRIIKESRGLPEDEAIEAVKGARIAGVGREDAARVVSRMDAGQMAGSDPLPLKGLAEKRKSFEVNLSDPTHEKWGYSGYVNRHQLSAHTADVQDARAAGYHEEQLEVPRPLNEKGEPAGKPWHEEILQHPAGADIFQSTALVARTEEFTAQRERHGEEWAKLNARNFMAGPAQSMQWSVARMRGENEEGGTGTVAIPEHVSEMYANRPKPTGYDKPAGRGTRMTKRDWDQM
jgi:hypothetical protein